MPEVKYGALFDEVARRRELEDEALEVESLRMVFIGISLALAVMTVLLVTAVGITQGESVDATAAAGASRHLSAEAKFDQ
jgi:hypothetical protein|tara:strand:+ start:2860 stop:3099 length:240 start_codon:yes stop_codon:yes gene_type:complete